jgi:hypothetical protein
VAKIIVPTPNTTITSAWGKSVADAINDTIVQRGIANATFTAGTSGTITFPVAFGETKPTIVATSLDIWLILQVVYSSITATAFQVKALTHDGVPYVGGAGVCWIAAGIRA